MGKNGSETKSGKFVSILKNNKLVQVADYTCCSKNFAKDFTVDYVSRHKHPVNAALHIVGVPFAFYGFYNLFSGKNVARGGIFVFLGYLLQYLGHRAQGNEVGEVTLAKSIYKKVKGMCPFSNKGS